MGEAAVTRDENVWSLKDRKVLLRGRDDRMRSL